MHPFQKVLDPPSGRFREGLQSLRAFPPQPEHVLQQEPAPCVLAPSFSSGRAGTARL